MRKVAPQGSGRAHGPFGLQPASISFIVDAAELAHLESLGEAGVLRALAEGNFGKAPSPRTFEVEAWLKLKELERSRTSSASAASIAVDQLKVARTQKAIAIAAIVVSAITAIIAAVIAGVLSYSSSSPVKLPAQGFPSANQSKP